MIRRALAFVVAFGAAAEQRLARVQLDKQTAETPHVDGGSVRQAQHHLRRPVEPALNVRVQLQVGKKGCEIDR